MASVVHDLEHIYGRYIDALNARRFDELEDFVHDRLVYNGASWSREQYRALLEHDVQTIPDLRYEVRTVVADQDVVAARLWFECHPAGKFLGMQADGRLLAFAEHVFYEFRDGRMTQVHSLIDAAAVRKQLMNESDATA